jgi:hypothetical protein
MAPPDNEQINFQEAGGVFASTASRTMKFYRVHEPELHNLTMAQGLMVLFFSAGSAFLGFGIDVAKDIAMTSGDLSAEGKVMSQVVQPACFYIATGFYIAGIWASFMRRSSIKRIKQESGESETMIDRFIFKWHQFRGTAPLKAADLDSQ